MIFVKIGLYVLLVLAPFQAFCRDLPPSFTMIGASNEASVLSMRCSGNAPFKNISCDFDQFSVSKVTQDEIDFSMEEMRNQIRKPKFRQEFLAYCKPVFEKKWEQEQVKEISNTWEKARPGVQQFYDNIRNSCECIKKNNYQDCLLKTHTEAESTRKKLCTVHHFRFSSDLKKVSEDTWISEAKPEGICNVVNVIKIDNEGPGNFKWTFTQTRAAVGSKAKECSTIKEGMIASYSWKNPGLWTIGCESIRFSP